MQRRIAFLWVLLLLSTLWGCEQKYPRKFTYSRTDTLTTSGQILNRLMEINEAAGWSNPHLSWNYAQANHFDDFERTRLYYTYFGETSRFDTLWVVDPNGDSIPGDPYDLEEIRTPVLDSQYVGPEGHFLFHFAPEDAGACQDLSALLQIRPLDRAWLLTLEEIVVEECVDQWDLAGESQSDFLENLYRDRILAPLKSY